MDNIIKNILIRNSDILKKNKINFFKLFNNYQTGGGKNLTVSYNDKKYIFKKSEDVDGHYVLFSKDKDECAYVIISEEDKIAEIHGLGSYSSCLQETNQNIGSTLLKITLKLLKKYQDKFQIKMIILTDNSIKKCNKVDIKLPIMMTLLTGDTWYSKYGFRPIKIIKNAYGFDEFEGKKYEQNKKIMSNIKISDIKLIKYIKMTNNPHIIKATKQIIKTSPDMLLKDFLSNFLKNYDKTCEYFSMFYEELYNKIRVYEPHRKFYGILL